jgi:hypothetical protein
MKLIYNLAIPLLLCSPPIKSYPYETSAWKRGGGGGERDEAGGRGEKWPKQCMHI